jgi:alkyl hydroperoxide reductase subunit AhpC
MLRSTCLAVPLIIAAVGLWQGHLAADENRAQPTVKSSPVHPPLNHEERQIAAELEKRLAPGSEARAMFETILSGESLGPDSGWWRIAKLESRFTWETVRGRYDTDRDGRVTPPEFPGSATDFDRLDADRDGDFDHVDLEITRKPLAKTAGFRLFLQADADSDGKVTRDEFNALFDAWDQRSLGFLAPSDLRHRLAEPNQDHSESIRNRGPNRETLLRGLARQEIGSLQAGPAVGDRAPDFTLTAINQPGDVRLSEIVGGQPMVLVFGNFTCGPFRRQSGNVRKLHRLYGDRVKFLMVYVREAHPTDGWSSDRNARHGIRIAQPASDDERRQVAARCAAHLDFEFPVLVDHVDDRVGALYSGMPNRLYLIDPNGIVAFKSGRGPFGFKPRALEQALVLVLNETVNRERE